MRIELKRKQLLNLKSWVHVVLCKGFGCTIWNTGKLALNQTHGTRAPSGGRSPVAASTIFHVKDRHFLFLWIQGPLPLSPFTGCTKLHAKCLSILGEPDVLLGKEQRKYALHRGPLRWWWCCFLGSFVKVPQGLWNTWAELWTEAYPPSSSLPSAGWFSPPPPPPSDWCILPVCSPYCLVC